MSLVDTRIDVDDFLPRVPLGHHRRSASLPLGLDEGSSGCLTLSYYSKLPEEPLKLAVLKLDGSSFDVEVMRSATVVELKEAVEAVFSHVPRKGPGKISWSHVWTHFCLCFDGQKLVEDTDYIRDYGIRDGDELQFIRHLSTRFHSSSKKRSSSKRKNSLVRQSSLLSLPKRSEQDHIDDEAVFYDNMENGKHQYFDAMDYKVARNEDMFVRLFRRWLPYSKLSTTEGTRSLKGSPSPTRSNCGLFNSCKRALHISSSSHYSLRDYRDE